MFVSEVNNTKIFNLSAGKSLPDVRNCRKMWCEMKFLHVFFNFPN